MVKIISLFRFCGAWPGTKSELDKIRRELEAGRKVFKTRDSKHFKDIPDLKVEVW